MSPLLGPGWLQSHRPFFLKVMTMALTEEELTLIREKA